MLKKFDLLIMLRQGACHATKVKILPDFGELGEQRVR